MSFNIFLLTKCNKKVGFFIYYSFALLLLSLILLNIAGGDCVEDLRILEKDEGFVEVLQKMETYKLYRKERRELER